jgi:hypothetical protein
MISEIDAESQMKRAGRLLLCLLAIPIMQLCLASVLFWRQGGFGAGHGPADFVIAILGLPSILICKDLDYVPFDSGYVLVILMPFLFNSLLWSLPALSCWLIAWIRSDG